MIVARPKPRGGVAAVEFAVVFTFVLAPLLYGLLQMGALIIVHQLMANAAREACRIAAQGQIIYNPSPGVYEYKQILVNGPAPSVIQTAKDFLVVNKPWNMNFTNTLVEFEFTDGDTSKTQPWEAVKGQGFSVTLSVPWADVRLCNVELIDLPAIAAAGDRVAVTSHWASMIDDPFQVNTAIPTWSPIPD